MGPLGVAVPFAGCAECLGGEAKRSEACRLPLCSGAAWGLAVSEFGIGLETGQSEPLLGLAVCPSLLHGCACSVFSFAGEVTPREPGRWPKSLEGTSSSGGSPFPKAGGQPRRWAPQPMVCAAPEGCRGFFSGTEELLGTSRNWTQRQQ